MVELCEFCALAPSHQYLHTGGTHYLRSMRALIKVGLVRKVEGHSLYVPTNKGWCWFLPRPCATDGSTVIRSSWSQ